ncbi:MAG: hypothetical protein JXR76_19690 [Deltaproteobacteria bacterium]|nr:hypothetical protein [Deltaproteobacteria bacterium]
MTNQAMLKKIDWFILLYGILLSCGVFLLWGAESFISVFIGVAVSYINWILSRTVGHFLIRLGKGELVVIILLLKTIVLMAVVFLILLLTSVEPISFMIGLSSLVVSVLTKSFSFCFVEDDTDKGDNE